MAVGSGLTCVCDAAGVVECWGSRGERKPNPLTRARPRRITAPPCKALVAGSSYACALSRGGAVHCWGQSAARFAWLAEATVLPPEGRHGNDEWHDDSVPIEGLSGVRALRGGERHACAITADAALRCWGANHVGQLSDGAMRRGLVAVPLEHVLDAAAGSEHTCASTARGIFCWGIDPAVGCRVRHLELMFFERCRRATPTQMSGPARGEHLRAGFDRTCMLSDAGDLACWGLPWGQTRRPPVLAREPTVDGRGVVTFDIEGDSGCLLNEQGEVRCWGPILGAWRLAQDPQYQVPDELLSPPGAVVLEIHGDRVEPRELP